MSTKEKSGQARYGGNHGTESKTHRKEMCIRDSYNKDTILSADTFTPELTVRKHEEWLCDQTEREYGI